MHQSIFFSSLSLVILLTCINASQEFSAESALEYWHYAMSSRCPETNLTNWEVGSSSKLYPGMTVIKVIHNTTGNALAYIGYQKNQDIIYIVFRGTEFTSIINWIENSKFTQIPYEYCICTVHEGFYSQYLSLKNELIQYATELTQKNKNAKIRLVGHSLGGAMATLAAFDISSRFGKLDSIYTFGSPRVGDVAFATWWNKVFADVLTARITHQRDPVPHMAPESWGYRHVNTEIFFEEEDATNYKVCEKDIEDPECSNKYTFALNVMDHVTYMEVNSIFHKYECKQ